MTVTINPKPIILREMQTAVRAVDTPADIYDMPVAIGEKVFVRNRNADFELLKTSRDKYLDIQSPSDADNSPNYVSITGASLGADFSPLPVATVMEFWVRLDAITTASNVPWMFRFGGERVGFMMSSGFIRFRPLWTSVGGGVSAIANNGSGLVRITTASAHGRTTGDSIYLTGVTDGSTITAKYYTVTAINSTTLDLQNSTFTGAPFGGTVNQHIKFAIWDEDNIPQNAEELQTDVWYRIVLTTQNTTITLSGTGLHIGPYYRNARIHMRDFRITTPTNTIYWDFKTGSFASQDYSPQKTIVANGAIDPDTIAFIDDELLGNNRDLLEQESPYRLYRIAPNDGFVTPENFGAVKQFSTIDTDPAIDATAIVQECINSPYNVLIDGYYYVPNPMYIAKPKTIKLVGTSDGTQFPGRDVSLGCLYQGATPRDMFRIFSGGVNISGGLFDFRNCVYDTAGANVAPNYVPPAVFRYCYYFNLIQNGSITTTCVGDEARTRVYNGGHDVVFWDASRTYTGDPQSKPAGFGEPHYIDFNIEARFMHFMVDGRLGEPYQDYTSVLVACKGFKTTTPTTDGGTFYISSASDYVIANNDFRIMTLKWGTDSHFTIRAYSGGTSASVIASINSEIVDAGYSTNTAQGVVPAFKAETRVSGGTNQSFTIRSNQSTFKLTCVRPPLATVFNYNLRDIGCKMTGWWETGDVSNIKTFCQTAETLANAGVTIDGVEPTEWNLPKVVMKGVGCVMDIKSIDLGKGTNPTYKTNIWAYRITGFDHELIGDSIGGLEINDAMVHSVPENVRGVFRNHRQFSHTRYNFAGTGRDGFIGSLDNVLAMCNKKWPSCGPTVTIYDNDGSFDFAHLGRGDTAPLGGAVSNGALATIHSPNNVFTIGGASCNIEYNAGFDETRDFVEIVLKPTLTAVGGGILTIANNGSGLVRITTNSAHGRTTGQTVYLSGITGGTTINNKYWVVTSIDSTRVDLQASVFAGSPTGGAISSTDGFNGEIDLLTSYVELYGSNQPRKAQLILVGSTSTTSKEYDLIGSQNNWLVFDGFNNGATIEVILRLIGIKDKSQSAYIAQWAGVSKNFKHSLNPFLSNAGGVRIFNTTEFEGLRIKDGGSTYRTVVPQSAASVTDYASLRAALVAGGFLYE